jgi:hypothetical protein
MSNQPTLDSLRADLIRRGLPIRYVRRVVEELQDHQQDLVDEKPTTSESRLGDLTDLADRIVAEFRASRFAGRHPILAFVITPIPLVIAACVTVFLAAALLSMSLEEAMGATGRNAGAYVIYLGLRFLPFGATALFLCRWAYRSGRGGWSLIACLLVALLAGTFLAVLKFPVGDADGTMMFGTLLLTPGMAAMVVGQQLAQIAMPLAIWLWFALRFERRRRLAARAAA